MELMAPSAELIGECHLARDSRMTDREYGGNTCVNSAATPVSDVTGAVATDQGIVHLLGRPVQKLGVRGATSLLVVEHARGR